MNPRITFNLTIHSIITNRQVVEVLVDGAVAATITPGEHNEAIMRIVSAHFKGDQGDQEIPDGVRIGPPSILPYPALFVEFDPKPYVIEDGKIRRGEIIHMLWDGAPMCGFSNKHPRDWPKGHICTQDPSKITCTECALEEVGTLRTKKK